MSSDSRLSGRDVVVAGLVLGLLVGLIPADYWHHVALGVAGGALVGVVADRLMAP